MATRKVCSMNTRWGGTIFLTKTKVRQLYGVDNRTAESVLSEIEPVGVHLGAKIYARPDVEKAMKGYEHGAS